MHVSNIRCDREYTLGGRAKQGQPCLNSGCKILGCHIGCHMMVSHAVFDTNKKKQITESISNPRDEFIKPN